MVLREVSFFNKARQECQGKFPKKVVLKFGFQRVAEFLVFES